MKIEVVQKIRYCLFSLAFVLCMTYADAQDSLRMSSKDVLAQIESKYHHKLQFTNAVRFPDYVTIHKEAALKDLLEALLQGTGYTYSINGTNIFLVQKKKSDQKERRGRVVDKNNNPLPGATLRFLPSNKIAVSDQSGEFSYAATDKSVVIDFVGYETRTVNITATDALQIVLQEKHTNLGEVVVSARRQLNNEVALLNDRRKSITVQDGISAQTIANTVSISSSEAMQRVTGVSVTDGKYIAIRGLSDRNIVAQLNGARLSTANSDRSAVPLDLVSADLLDNITVYKTVTPDRPSDATAGIVELKTKTIPEKMIISFSAMTGFNSVIGPNGSFNSFINGDLGAFGSRIKQHHMNPEYLDLLKQYKDLQVPLSKSNLSEQDYQEAVRINKILESFDPVLTTAYRKAPLNQVYNFSFGNRYKVFGKHQLGVILGLNYFRKSESIVNGQNNLWSFYAGAALNGVSNNPGVQIPSVITPNNIVLMPYQLLKENAGTEQLNYGGLAGLTYKFSPKNEISLYYISNKGAESSGSSLVGNFASIQYVREANRPIGISNEIYTLRLTERLFNTLQLKGEHKLGAGRDAVKLNWSTSGSVATQDDPDFRTVNLAIDTLQQLSLTRVRQPEFSYPSSKVPSGRYFRKLKEENRNYTLDLSKPFEFSPSVKMEAKAGVFYLNKERDFTESLLSIPQASDLLYVNGNLNALLAPERVGIRENLQAAEGAPVDIGFLYNLSRTPNSYIGYQRVKAGYGMLQLDLFDKWVAVGGLRLEKTIMKGTVDTTNAGVDQSKFTEAQKDSMVRSNYSTGYAPYASASLIYRFNERMNIRFAFSNTLQRAELLEMLPVTQFDAYQNALVKGNRSLTNSRSVNFDLRWEWFPRPGEVLSASLFAKTIDSQIEKIFTGPTGISSDGPGSLPTISYRNNPERGQVQGVELEVRKNLGALSKALKNFNIGGSLMLARSDVKLDPDRLHAARIIDRRAPSKAPLFEQPSYVVNTSLQYQNSKIGTMVNVLYNVVGERLVEVQMNGAPDIYERPAHLLDFVVRQKVFKRIEATLSAKNLLDPEFKRVYTRMGEKGKYGTYEQEYIKRSYKRGTDLLIGLRYNF